MLDDVVRNLADRLLQARAGGGRVEAADPAWAGLDAASVYRVQAGVAAATGPAGGFKIARKPGQATIMAPIFAAGIAQSPASFPAGRFNRIGIELEVGFMVLDALPGADDPDFAAKAATRVAAVAAIEVVDTRLDDLDAAADLLKLADNQSNGGLVVGAPVRDWQALDLVRPRARLSLGDAVVLDGPAPVPGGNAFETFCALAAMVGDHCGGLHPGHVVITGSLNGLPWIAPGTDVAGEIEGLGRVEARFG